MFKLDLLENAISSLDEALLKYDAGRKGQKNAYKFCILHFSHFMELILKYYVTQAHPLLIYKNPFGKSIGEDSFTIGLPEAVQFLKNEGRNLPKLFLEDLEWLKKLRNKIEHHKFEMDISEVEQTIGRLMNSFHEFDEMNESIDLSNYISSGNYDTFHELAKTYTGRLAKAKAEVEAAQKAAYAGLRPKEYSSADFYVHACPECGHDTLIPNRDSTTGARCTFCNNEESEDIEVPCGICSVPMANGLMESTSEWGKICPHHFKR